MARDYIAFISYRHCPLDIAVAERLQQMLERYRVPKELRRQKKTAGLGLVFRDREELPLTSDLTADIYEALDHSQFLIVVCTPDTPKSDWVSREIAYFIRRHGRERVLTVLADGTPEEAIPPLLTHVYAEDGVTVLQEVEPLAAYVVANQPTEDPVQEVLKNLKKEFLRLVAAILECPYDALRQRQKRYQQRRISCFLGAAALIALGFLGLLIHKNLQIQTQLRLSQQNESYALSLVSRQLLEQGDRHGAIENALDALPGDGEERPLSTEAVQALANALYAYGDDALRFDAQIEQDTYIQDLTLSRDGCYAATIDSSGCVRGFNTGREEELWQAQFPVEHDYQFVAFYILDDQKAVLCIFAKESVLLDLESGEERLRFEYDLRGGNMAFSTALSGDGTLLAMDYRTESDEAGSYAHDVGLIIYDTRTGQEVSCTEALPLPPTMYLYDLHFSGDGSTLVAGLSNSSTCTYAALTVDSASGQVLNQYTFSLNVSNVTDQDILVSLLDDDSLLIYASYQIDYGSSEIIYLVRVSTEGTLLFEQFLGSSLGISAKQPEPVALQSSNTMCYVYQNCVLGVSLDLGRKTFLTELPADMLYCQINRENARLLLALNDGSIRCLTTWDGELLDTDTDGWSDPGFNLHTVYGVPDAETPVICIIPEGELNRAVLMRVLGDDNAEAITAPPQTPSFEALSIELISTEFYPFPSGDRFLCFDRDSTDGSDSNWYCFTIYDADTLEITDSFELVSEEWLSLAPTGFSADGTKVYFEEFVVDLTSHALDTLEGWQEDFYYISSRANSLSLSAQNSGQPALTAFCDSDLYWWVDGEPHSTPFPYDFPFNLYSDDDPQSAVQLGGRLIVLKNYFSDDRDRPVGYAVYSIDEDRWTYLDSPSTAAGYPVLCVGSDHPWVALADYDGILRIYDQKSDAVVRELELPATASAIEEMQFLPGDSVLLIRTLDSRAIFVDTETGRELGRFALEGCSRLTIQADEQAHTLYLSDSCGKMTGLCIDTETWTVTAAIPRLACYLPASHRVVNLDSSCTALQSYPVYTPENLVEWGNAVLDGDRS